jgi:hypothetical protein
MKEKKYISLKSENNNVTIKKIGENTYLFREIVPIGELSLEIQFLMSKSGVIGGYVSNNYFDYEDKLNHFNEYRSFKNNLLSRVRLDLEEKRSLAR